MTAPTQCEHSHHDAAGIVGDPCWAPCPACGEHVRIYGPSNDRRWGPHNVRDWPNLGDAISGFYCPEMMDDKQ